METALAFETGIVDYSVHRLELADAPALQQLLEKSADYALLVEGEYPSPTAAQEVFTAGPPDKSLDDKFVFGFIDCQKAVVGLLEGMRDYPTPATWWIGLFLLAPEIRGHGIGRRLLGSFLKYAASHGATAVMLGVVEENSRARQFWQRSGFEFVRKTEPRQFGQKMQAVYVLRQGIHR